MISKAKYVLMLWFSINLLQSSVAADSELKIIKRPLEGYTLHIHYLTPYQFPMPDGNMQDWIRQRFPKTPGDYFREPDGADTTTIIDREFSEVRELLTENVYNSFYDDFILENLDGYEYTMGKGSVHRREYHIYYARGDTIYVISGWLGKFLSFYRAVPGNFRYDIDELQNQVELISPSYRKTKGKSFKQIDEERNYLLEYVDKENMMRVRNYLVDATFIFDDTRQGETLKYNLIEVTRFIDEDVIP